MHNINKDCKIYKCNALNGVKRDKNAPTIRIVERILEDKLFKATLKYNDLIRGNIL